MACYAGIFSIEIVCYIIDKFNIIRQRVMEDIWYKSITHIYDNRVIIDLRIIYIQIIDL